MTPDDRAPERRARRDEPISFRARSLAASLTVDDLQESLRWYRDVVLFTVEDEWEDGELRGVSLIAGEVHLMLNQDDGAKGWDRQKGEGFSLHFTTVQDVDEIAAGIKKRGGTLEQEPTDMPWGGRALALRDPDGFKLTISTRGEGDA